MPGMLPKKFPVPVAAPLWPFAAGALIVFAGINSLQNVLSDTAEFRNDPRNTAAKNNTKH